MAKLTGFGALGATDSTVEMGTSNCSQVGVNVTGTWTGTITFEVRRGQTWENAQVFTVAGVAAAATTTANVNRRIDTGGTNSVRARFSTATSGAPNIQFDGTEAGMGGSGGGGGGGGASTIADGADVAQGTTTDAGVITDTSGTVIGFLRGLVKLSLSGITAVGNKTSNGAVPDGNNIGALPAIATAAAPSNTEGRMVAQSVDLAGNQRVIGSVTADTELPAAAALSDATANPTAPMVGAALMGWDGAAWERNVLIAGGDAKNNALVGIITGAFNYVFNGATWDRLRGNTSGLFSQGTVAHDAVDAGNPIKEGRRAIAHGTNPTAVSAADRTDLYANVAGIPFAIGGHPNVVTVRANYTAAQTDTALVTIGAGLKIVCTRLTFACDKANLVNVAARAGFGTANTPTTTGVLAAHPGIDPGGGMNVGNGAGIIGIGADNEDLRVTCGVPTGGSIDVCASYYTVEV